jgi:pimeloyl-ACP methyl ester carboxylesterase
MELEPKLIDVHVPTSPKGAVLVLHGGASRRENMMVSPTQLSVLRMIPIAKRIARSRKDELAVFRLLNSRRGWDTSHTPVKDAHWGLDCIADRLRSPVPTVLVGHSLGGRAAILAATRNEVRGAVALAPYVYRTDVPSGLRGQEILIVHGSGDRIASPTRAFQLAERLASLTPTAYVLVKGAKHAMLRRHDVFSNLAADFSLATLLGRSETETMRRIGAGETFIEL